MSKTITITNIKNDPVYVVPDLLEYEVLHIRQTNTALYMHIIAAHLTRK